MTHSGEPTSSRGLWPGARTSTISGSPLENTLVNARSLTLLNLRLGGINPDPFQRRLLCQRVVMPVQDSLASRVSRMSGLSVPELPTWFCLFDHRVDAAPETLSGASRQTTPDFGTPQFTAFSWSFRGSLVAHHDAEQLHEAAHGRDARGHLRQG